jgi:hypothetical protein
MYYSYVEIEYVATSFSPARTDLALKLLMPSTLHSVPLPLGVLLFKCLLSMHMRCTPIYIHKAGSMCFVPTITSTSLQLVMMQFLECWSTFCCDFFEFELVICASMINV